MNVHSHVLLGVAGLRLGRGARAAQVGNDDGVALGEQRHDRTPHVAGLGIAVQQDNRAAFAANEIVQSDSVDPGEALGNASDVRLLHREFCHPSCPFQAPPMDRRSGGLS